MRRRATESETKDAFIGVVSHELRTPITTLKLQVELLSREAGSTLPSARARLESIQRAIARMEGLVEDLLGLSAIRTGTMTLRRERADLVPLCKLAADEQELIAQRQVSVDLPPQPVLAVVDPRRIQQVLSSLLSNALKYSPPDRPVALRLRRTDGEAILSVRDEGPGIPADALAHLFERFYRVPGSEVTTGSRIGLGLGLFVSEAIVRGHGGQIDVESEIGRGSTFSVRLPLVT